MAIKSAKDRLPYTRHGRFCVAVAVKVSESQGMVSEPRC